MAAFPGPNLTGSWVYDTGPTVTYGGCCAGPVIILTHESYGTADHESPVEQFYKSVRSALKIRWQQARILEAIARARTPQVSPRRERQLPSAHLCRFRPQRVGRACGSYWRVSL